ncbi:MAG: glycosyltransferase family 4 protein [Acidobacteriota bacterium]
MKVLALCSYPEEAAATRFRIQQYIEPLSRQGIEITVRPFLNGPSFKSMYQGGSIPKKVLGVLSGLYRRFTDVPTIRRYDLIFVQREAMLFGPAVFEWLYQKFGSLPMVLDLDDATYVRYVSPTYGRLGSFFKFFGKTDALIRRASTVICGNRFISAHVESLGTAATIVPTVVDTEIFRPADHTNEIPVIGWIGTHSSYPFLEAIFPIIAKLAESHTFRLKIVGSGRRSIAIAGVEVENVDWALDREVEDFQSMDIGLYPLSVIASANEEWLAGKSGFKAIQYMAVGVPFVMTPVGVCSEIGVPGNTHFNAASDEDWYNSLETLLADKGLRSKMGNEARAHSLENFGVDLQADRLAAVLNSAVKNESSPDN